MSPGGVLPYIGHIGMCPPKPPPHHRVRFLRRFGLKTGKEFAHFGLESGMVFEETTGVYERICRSFQFEMNQKERVMSEFEMVFKKSFPV